MPQIQSKCSEAAVVKKCTLYLRKQGWETFKIYTGGIPVGGKLAANPCKGIPDCIAFHIEKRKCIWIEYKNSEGGTVSPEQKRWHSLLKIAKQHVFVVKSLEVLKQALEKVENENQ